MIKECYLVRGEKMSCTYGGYKPKAVRSRTEFFNILDEVITLWKRPVRECDKPSELNEKEKDIIYALQITKTMEE